MASPLPTFSPITPEPPKKPKTKKIIIGTLIGLVSLFIICGCIGATTDKTAPKAAVAVSTGSTQSDNTSPETGGVLSVSLGQTVSYTTTSGKKLEVSVSNVNRNAESKNSFITPKKGGFITAQVSIKYLSGGSGTYMAVSTDFDFVGSDGTLFPVQLLDTAGFDAGLDTMTLNPGQKASGVVAFDVDRSKVAGGKIQFNDFGRSATLWAIP